MKSLPSISKQLLLAGLLSLVFIQNTIAQLSVSPLFSEHVVLQQNEKVAIWGTANPNQTVNIRVSWSSEITRIDSDNAGNWFTRIQTPAANSEASYKIEIASNGVHLNIKDVLIGEVWLASGQSNMEMPLVGYLPNEPIDNYEEEVNNANYDKIRFIDVNRAVATRPKEDFNGKWKVINPTNAKTCSATAYFFARKLYKELNVPIGIVNSTWGGTPVESWMSKEKIIDLNEFEKELDAIKEENIAVFEKWYSQFEKMKINFEDIDWKNLDFQDKGYEAPDFDDTSWKTAEFPKNQVETIEVQSTDGVYWLRKKFDIDDVNHSYSFHVEGGIDDIDMTYINGQKIGFTACWNCPRTYAIPSNLLKKGENTVAIKIIDTGGGGGFLGSIYLLKETDKKISLDGTWKYSNIAGYQSSEFILYNSNPEALKNTPEGLKKFKLDANTPSVLFNGMINPIIPFNIRGAIWYQGESNVGREDQYLKLFPGMIEDWRTRWKDDFSFYFVQIAPFSYGNELSPALRDAQRLSLKTPKTGMAVTMDIGHSTSIHPGNKQDVGDRLARLALANDYKKDIIALSPLYKSHSVKGKKIIIEFDGTGSGLMLKNGGETGFEIAGEDGNFVPAQVKVKKNKVIVKAATVTAPKQVRYGWKDYIEGTLFNKEGLPASSFITELD